MAVDAAAARWVARLPGPAQALLGPAQVPRVHNLHAVCRRPALALLSMIMHGRDDRQIGVTALQGLALTTPDLRRRRDWLEEREQLILRHAAPGERP
ncbi:MAG: hypothetical protein KC457_28385, partial [Myxococcales bacterium]|nr:hypothetical protein [Myxococcales bacterium]